MNLRSIADSILDNLVKSLLALAIPALLGLIYSVYSSLNAWQWLLLAFDLLILTILLAYRYNLQTIIGLRNIDRNMKHGITPDKALAMCNNNIMFLGIAANKLISSPEFEKAIKRCNRSTKSLKFLLSHPDNVMLKHAASRAKKDVTEFKDKVVYSLNKLKRLKQDHGYNIEVRLYKSVGESGPPSFRLFFIDEASVLVSYYILGEGEGLQMPQMQLIKSKRKRDTESFYYAFEHYFNALWASSEEADL
jgi:hypothetical protein